MLIRLATPEDKDQILALLDEFSLLINAHEIPSKIGSAIFDEIISRPDTKIFIADDNGKLLGLATFYILPNIRHGWHRGHIEDFFVTGSTRSRGVGTAIFNAIREFCYQNDIKVIKLDSDKRNTKAHNFYKKNGGEPSETMFRFDL